MGNPISKDNSLYGLVLTGGKSTRMGTNKALLNYHGKPQYQYIASLLSTFCSSVFISTKQKDLYPSELIIEDNYNFESPLNGILSAFNYSPTQAWLVVACDMPFIDTHSINYLLTHRKYDKLSSSYLNKDGNAEPLFSVWEPHSVKFLFEYQQQGNYSPRKFMMTHDCHLITPKEDAILRNINTLEEYNNVINNLS